MVDTKAKAKIDLELAKAKLKVVEAKKHYEEQQEPTKESNSWENFFD